jgi:tetratricopeptide (TPR) repeat protein
MWLAGDLTAGAARIEKALAVLADEQPDADLAALIEFHARLRYFLGDHDVARERIERALEIAEALVAHDVLIDALNTKHLILTSHNRVEEGMALLERAIAIGRQRPPGRSLSRALYNLSFQLAGRDRFADALEIDRETVELARRRGERVEEQMALGHMATSLLELGRWDEAYELASDFDPAASARAAGDRSNVVWLLANRGDSDKARREFELIRPHFDDSERQMLSYRLYVESVLLLAEGAAVEALAVSRRGLDIARDDFTLLHPLTKWILVSALEAAFELGDREAVIELLVTTDEAPPVHRTPLVEAIAAQYGGRLLALDGDLDGAERMLRFAAAHYGEIDTRFERARALLRLGEILATSRPEDAAVSLGEARQIFTSLGARPWLARVDAVDTTVFA